MLTLGHLNGPFPAFAGPSNAWTLKRDPDCPQSSLGPGVLECGVAHAERPKTVYSRTVVEFEVRELLLSSRILDEKASSQGNASTDHRPRLPTARVRDLLGPVSRYSIEKVQSVN